MSALPIEGPKFRAFDANGDPLAGGKLYSYAAGTTTPQDTFTTRAGNIANANPVILDGEGYADVWTSEGLLYKFVLKDSSDVVQWTVDNFPSGSQTVNTTSDLVSAVEPGGRLTLASGTAVTPTDQTAAATIYYTPYRHAKIPLYDGVSSWTLYNFSELSQALSDNTKSPAAAVANSNYDLFVWIDSGTLRLSRGPPWSSSVDRGSGAGTSAIQQINGRYVNAFSISNGPGAQLGLYVGTIRTGADAKAYDYNLSRYVWNAHNRVPRPMLCVEATATWTYSTNAYRQANASSANQLNIVVGLVGEAIDVEVHAANSGSGAGPDGHAGVGIGLDGSTTNSANVFAFGVRTSEMDERARAFYRGVPTVGAHSFLWLECGSSSGATDTWYGNQTGLGGTEVAASGILGTFFA